MPSAYSKLTQVAAIHGMSFSGKLSGTIYIRYHKVPVPKTLTNLSSIMRRTESRSCSSSAIQPRRNLCKDRKQKIESCGIHLFSSDEAASNFCEGLLRWYDHNKRELQWRELAKHEDPNVRGYSVLVSEIMLQQTQVTTVKSYYEKWMKKWPTFEALSKATLQEVHAMWAGLGYYSRGKRLHDVARKVVNEMRGAMPQDVIELRAKLPGVGPYTAAAVASIAYNQPVGAVDGNVIRVFSRVFAIGADTTQRHVIEKIRELADETVDRNRPGDFNQALMDLGALICTPKQPNCLACPISSHCSAYQRTRRTRGETTTVGDIEDDPNCGYCFSTEEPWIDKYRILSFKVVSYFLSVPAHLSRDGVMNYPRKRKKTIPKQARNAVVIVQSTVAPDNLDESKPFLLWQRPKQGLLASLWEFPSFALEKSDMPKANELSFARERLQDLVRTATIEQMASSDVYAVDAMVLPEEYQALKWMNQSEINECATSTAMKKVMQFYKQSSVQNSSASSKRKRNLRGGSQPSSRKKPCS